MRVDFAQVHVTMAFLIVALAPKETAEKFELGGANVA